MTQVIGPYKTDCVYSIAYVLQGSLSHLRLPLVNKSFAVVDIWTLLMHFLPLFSLAHNIAPVHSTAHIANAIVGIAH